MNTGKLAAADACRLDPKRPGDMAASSLIAGS
jgi:hypothetical protein